MTQISKKKLSAYSTQERKTMIPELGKNFEIYTALPDTMPAGVIGFYNGTFYRALALDEIFGVNSNTPFPLKGYRELVLQKTNPEFYITTFVNDFGFNFEIRNDAPGIYVLSRQGGAAIFPLPGSPTVLLFLSFASADSTFSYSHEYINLGEDTGKIRIRIMQHNESGNDLANAVFTLRLVANYAFNYAVDPGDAPIGFQ